jgi:DNA-binding MarR family transcriptional regulator
MSGEVARALRQKAAFASREQEVLLGLRLAAARVVEPWEAFLKAHGGLTPTQYNVLRILRGSHPARLAHGEIGDRMITRDPDMTRVIDRLSRRGLVARLRSRQDRRVVEVGITDKGLEVLRALDPHVDRMPKAVLGHLGERKLRQLAQLLEQAIAGLGTFP